MNWTPTKNSNGKSFDYEKPGSCLKIVVSKSLGKESWFLRCIPFFAKHELINENIEIAKLEAMGLIQEKLSHELILNKVLD